MLYMFLADVNVLHVTHLRQVTAIDFQMVYVLDIYWLIVVLPHRPMKQDLVSHTESYIYIVGSSARCSLGAVRHFLQCQMVTGT